MKMIEAAKLFCLGVLITVVGICLRGHDLLTGISLSLLALLVTLKLVFAFRARGGGGSPPSDEGDMGGRTAPRPPAGRPPALAAEAEIGTERAA